MRSKCVKGLVLLAVLGLRVGWSRRKIAKQDDVYIKDASRTLRLVTTRRWRRKVMSEPPTMPPVRRAASPTRRLLANVVLADRRATIIGCLPYVFLDGKPPIHAKSCFRSVTCVTFFRPRIGLN